MKLIPLQRLIKPCTIDIVNCLLDEKVVKLISNIPLSNTVARQISDIAGDVKETLISCIRCKFQLQMDELTDTTGLAVLMVFVCLLTKLSGGPSSLQTITNQHIRG